MTLLPLIAAYLLVGSLTWTMLAASAATARLGGDRRAAVEAALMLESSLARARIDHAATLNSMLPGQVLPLAVPAPTGWTVHASASRELVGDLLWLVVNVERRDADGILLAGRRGTLILAYSSADTAIVINSRPRF